MSLASNPLLFLLPLLRLPFSIHPCLPPGSPSLSPLAYAMNQNRFPWGTALNIILNFSFLISAASFTLNLLPRAKKQHGIHETCTHHRKCDYSLSISLSILFSHYPKQHGNRETCSHLRLEYFSFSLSCLLFPSPIPSLFLPPFQYLFISFFHSYLSRFMLSLLSPTSMSLFSAFLFIYISLPHAQR